MTGTNDEKDLIENLTFINENFNDATEADLENACSIILKVLDSPDHILPRFHELLSSLPFHEGTWFTLLGLKSGSGKRVSTLLPDYYKSHIIADLMCFDPDQAKEIAATIVDENLRQACFRGISMETGEVQPEEGFLSGEINGLDLYTGKPVEVTAPEASYTEQLQEALNECDGSDNVKNITAVIKHQLFLLDRKLMWELGSDQFSSHLNSSDKPTLTFKISNRWFRGFADISLDQNTLLYKITFYTIRKVRNKPEKRTKIISEFGDVEIEEVVKILKEKCC